MMRITERVWDKLPDGRNAHLIKLNNENGVCVTVSDYGGTIQSLCTPDRNGRTGDIVLGYDTLEEYRKGTCYFGATVGRCANRIAGASFRLGSHVYDLTANENGNTLHGGSGFHTKLWSYEVRGDTLFLYYVSPDGEDGFPGNLKTELRMTLSKEGDFRMTFRAISDRDTVCNFTGHSYFNLAGVGSSDSYKEQKTKQVDSTPDNADCCGYLPERAGMETVAEHLLMVNAETYTPTDDWLIPMGEVSSVEGTIYDFRKEHPVGRENLDGNLVINHRESGVSPEQQEDQEKDLNPVCPGTFAARVREPKSGRILVVNSSLPGIQLYNGGGIPECTGKGGLLYGPQSGLCLEPQFFPDAIHHSAFGQPVLKAGELYEHYIEYQFRTD